MLDAILNVFENIGSFCGKKRKRDPFDENELFAMKKNNFENLNRNKKRNSFEFPKIQFNNLNTNNKNKTLIGFQINDKYKDNEEKKKNVNISYKTIPYNNKHLNENENPIQIKNNQTPISFRQNFKDNEILFEPNSILYEDEKEQIEEKENLEEILQKHENHSMLSVDPDQNRSFDNIQSQLVNVQKKSQNNIHIHKIEVKFNYDNKHNFSNRELYEKLYNHAIEKNDIKNFPIIKSELLELLLG
jgi:hypothetical protein